MVKKVLKFGGTSVGTTERIQHVANIIKKEHSKGNEIIVVVSAMAGKTNELISHSRSISKMTPFPSACKVHSISSSSSTRLKGSSRGFAKVTTGASVGSIH